MSEKDKVLMSTPLAIVIAGAIIGGAIYLSQTQSPTTKTTAGSQAVIADNAGDSVPATQPPTQTAGTVPKVTSKDHIQGDPEAQIALIEYSDMECPFCKRFHPTAQQVVDEYAGKVMWVYRHFPLSFHANAQKEAEAAECANELGGNTTFWEYTNKIFERTTSNGTGFALDKLKPLAGEIGLDGNKFQDCLDSGKYEQHVKDDMAAGQAAGVTGTPGNFLLNIQTGEVRLIPGAVPFETIKQATDELL